jgi:anaerobic selenocysteine-containing dehydrogenase
MSERQILDELLRGASGPTALPAAQVENAGPIRVKPEGLQKFATPSGKLEIYSEAVAALGLSPLPDWKPDPEEVRDAARWPLRLLTAPSYFQPHTAYSAVAFLRGREGEPWCVLHPQDAAARKLADGQKVSLANDRGRIGLVLRVSDEIRPGVVLVPGQRPDEEAVHGTINMLCSDRYTDIGEGATYQSTWLEVAAWKEEMKAATA